MYWLTSWRPPSPAQHLQGAKHQAPPGDSWAVGSSEGRSQCTWAPSAGAFAPAVLGVLWSSPGSGPPPWEARGGVLQGWCDRIGEGPWLGANPDLRPQEPSGLWPRTLSFRQCQEPLKLSSAACALPRPAPSPLLLAPMLPQTCPWSGSFLQQLPETTPPSLHPHPCTWPSATEPRGCWSCPLRSEAPCQGDPAPAWMPPSQGPGRLVCSQTRRVVRCEAKRGNQVLDRLPGEAELKGQAPRQTSRGETGLPCRCWGQPGGHSDQPDLHAPAPVGHARGAASLDEEVLAQPLLHVLQLRCVRGLPGTTWSSLSRMASLESVSPGPTPSAGEAPAPQACCPGP